MGKGKIGTCYTFKGDIKSYFVPSNVAYGVSVPSMTTIRLKSQLLVKVINKLSFELGHPKDDLVKIVKQMIKKAEL